MAGDVAKMCEVALGRSEFKTLMFAEGGFDGVDSSCARSRNGLRNGSLGWLDIANDRSVLSVE